MPGTVFREPILLGNNDDAHKIFEVITGQVTLDFGSAAGLAGQYGTATGTLVGARTGMMFFIGPWDVAAANVSGTAVVPISIICQTADTISVSALNSHTAAIDMGSAQYPVLGIRRT